MTGKMKILKTLMGAWLLMACASLVAQTTPEEIYATIEKSGGAYYAYPEVHEDYTPAPEGYEPFYISHYGRHGSRFLISDNDYVSVMKILEEADKAGALSEAGRNVRQRLDIVWQEADGLGGALTPLGVRQHRGIAERMFSHYPEVFRDNRTVTARSTVVVRCVLSMAAFCERLKEENPSLNVTRESGERYMRYLSYWDEASREFNSQKSDWHEIYNRFRDEHLRPDRLMKLLFTDDDYVQKNVDAKELMMSLYWIASDMQNVEIDVSFYDIFEKEELFAIWQIQNFRFYVGNGTSAYGKEIIMTTVKPLLQNILDEADKALQDPSIAASLRFGHDANVMPLAGILELENCYNVESDPNKFYQAWSDFKIAPMAGNIQIIFFRKKNTDNILVKFLLNEKEVSIPVQSDIKPYYYWQDVEKYYKDKLVEK
jgi:hypothetical protein